MHMQDHAGSSGRLHTTTPIPPPLPHCLRAVLGLAGSLVLPTTAGFGPTLVAAGRSRRRGLRAARRGAAGTSRRAARARRQCPWAAGSPSRHASRARPSSSVPPARSSANTAPVLLSQTQAHGERYTRGPQFAPGPCKFARAATGQPKKTGDVVERHAEHTRADSLHNHAQQWAQRVWLAEPAVPDAAPRFLLRVHGPLREGPQCDRRTRPYI